MIYLNADAINKLKSKLNGRLLSLVPVSMSVPKVNYSGNVVISIDLNEFKSVLSIKLIDVQTTHIFKSLSNMSDLITKLVSKEASQVTINQLLSICEYIELYTTLTE